MTKVVVVTGANKGIGFSVVKLLLQEHPDWTLLLCSRDVERGQKAVDRLKSEFDLTAHLRILDIDSLHSIKTLKASLIADFPGGIDILINNAGIFIDTKLPTSADDDAKQFKFNVDSVKATVRTNFFGTYNVCQELIPLLKKDGSGRVINVSSRLAQTIYMNCTKELQQKIATVSTLEQVLELMSEFCQLDPSLYESVGWLGKPAVEDCLPGYPLGLCLPYGVSKVGINLLTKVYQRQHEHLSINAMCPGDAATDMVPTGKQSADFSADTITYLALLPEQDAEKVRGQFLAERKTMDFFELNETQWNELLALM